MKQQRAGGFLRTLSQQKVLLLFLLPAMGLVLVFNYIPMFGLVMAFQDYKILEGYFHSDFVGLANFKEFFASPDFYQALRNTIAINLICLVVVFPMPIIFSVLLNELVSAKLKKTIQTITYLPYFISWVVVGGLFYKLLESKSGVVNVLLHSLGMEDIPFFREAQYFWPIIIFATIWKGIGWNSILYLSAINSIDPHLYEAAEVDGANRFQRIWNITLPGIAGTAVFLFVLTVGSLMNGSGGASGSLAPNFEALWNFRNALVAGKSDVLDIYAYQQGVQGAQYAYAAAIGVFQSLMSLVLLFSCNFLIKKWRGEALF
ncbi:ABC transporter permease [Cohnella silvisoli]|uniref:ABC transporter permease subunit n=1 Tax=Cohnella silvisoli TaxID=2873699 RepID=A0ABV1KRV4_9BACL|nr:ABC transporter permease subunit [Cohnella silvisoli]MCD9021687.1 ABC transporter permease subunit [Cohnella silvisoli]